MSKLIRLSSKIEEKFFNYLHNYLVWGFQKDKNKSSIMSKNKIFKKTFKKTFKK